MAVSQSKTHTDKLVERYMQEEVLRSDFDFQEFRLSETGSCSRMRVLKACGYEPTKELTQDDARYFERGNLLETWIADRYRERHPRKLRKQVEVETPLGDVGHIDFWWPEKERIIEVKSTSERITHFDLPRPEDRAQVMAYMHFFTDYRGERRCDEAEVAYVLYGRKLDIRPVLVQYDPDEGQKIEEELRHLHERANQKDIPAIPDDASPLAYPCFWTTKDESDHFCRMYEHCWGPDPVDAEEVEEDPTIQQILAEYKKVCDNYSQANKRTRHLKDTKKEIETALERHFDMRDADALKAEGVQVRRVPMSGRTYWKPDKALEQGLIDEETLEAIESVSSKSSGYTRWYTKEVE